MIDSVPLIQNVAKDDINTSIIALKKEEKRLEQLITEADAKIKELNELKVNVSDIVNEVTSGNMHSVSSNAVAEAFNGDEWETVENSIQCKRIGNIVFIYVNDSIYFSSTGSYAKSYSTNNTIVLPEKYRPTKEINVFMAWNNNDVLFRLRVYPTGRLRSWNVGSIMALPTGSSNHQWESFICYCVN